MHLVRRFTDLPMKRLYKYLLRKSVGTYLLGELTVDQLDVQIVEGEVNLLSLQVNADVVNSHLQGTPVRIQSGSIGRIHLSVPITSLLSKPVVIELFDVNVVLAPPSSSSAAAPGKAHGAPMQGTAGPPLSGAVDPAAQEGIDVFMALVNKVLSQVVIRVVNFRLQLSAPSVPGHAVTLTVPLLELRDETPNTPTMSDVDPGLAVPDIVHKCITMPEASVTLNGPGGDTVLFRAASPSSDTRVKVVWNGAPHLHRHRPAVDVTVFVHDIQLCADPREMVRAWGIVSSFMPPPPTSSDSAARPATTPVAPPLSASAILDAVPFVSGGDDDEEALEALVGLDGGPVDSLTGLGSHMFASAVGFGSVAVPVYTNTPPPLTFALRVDVIACTARVPVAPPGAGVAVVVDGLSVSACSGEPTVVSINGLRITEKRSGDGVARTVGRIGTTTSLTSAGHAVRVEVPADPTLPTAVSLGAITLTVDDGFVSRLMDVAPSSEPDAVASCGDTVVRSKDRSKRSTVEVTCPSVNCQIGQLRIVCDSVAVDVATLTGSSHVSTSTSVSLSSLQLFLNDALLIHSVKPRFTVIDKPCSWEETGFVLFPDVVCPLKGGGVSSGVATMRVWEEDDDNKPAPTTPDDNASLWSNGATQCGSAVVIQLGKVMIDMSSAQYLALLDTIDTITGPPKPASPSPSVGSSGAKPARPPLLIAVGLTEATIRYRRDTLQRDLTLFGTGLSVGVLLSRDEFDLTLSCASLAAVSCVSVSSGPPLVVCHRQPSTPLTFQPQPMLCVRVSARPDAVFGKKTTVIIDACNALFPSPIAWDWILDILDLCSPEDPHVQVKPQQDTLSASTSANALTVVFVNITSSALLHTLPGGDAVHPSPAMMLRLGSLQVTCNVLKHVKEQGIAVSVRDVELQVSKHSTFDSGTTVGDLVTAVLSLRARAASSPLFVSSSGRHPTPDTVACVFPVCTVDTERAGFLRVAHLSALGLRARLPGTKEGEITVEAEGGLLTGMGCLDTLILTSKMVNQFGDAFADVATCVSAIEKCAVPVDESPVLPRSHTHTSANVLAGVDHAAFAPVPTATITTPTPTGVTMPAVTEYFSPVGPVLPPALTATPAPVISGLIPEVSPDGDDDDEDDDEVRITDGLALGWAIDDDEDEFGDAVGDFGGVYGDVDTDGIVVAPPPVSLPPEVAPPLSLPVPAPSSSPLSFSPPRASPRIPLTDSDADLQALSFDDSGEADAGATEEQGVWYDGVGPGAVRVYAGRGKRLLGIRANPNHFDAPEAIDPRLSVLTPHSNEFGDDSDTRKGRISISFSLTTLDVSFKLFGGCDWPDAPVSSAAGLFDVREPALPPAAHRRVAECVEVMLTGLSVSFQGYSHDDDSVGPWKWSLDSVLLFAVRDIEVLDRIAASPLHLILGHWREGGGNAGAPLLRVRLDKVLPTAAGPLTYLLSQPRSLLSEVRVHVSVQPLRLIAGQAVIDMAMAIVRSVEEEDEHTVVKKPPPPTHIQVFVLDGVAVNADYEPGTVSASGLRRGELAELLKLIPISGLQLQLVRVCEWNLSGWDALGAKIAAQWAAHIRKHQAHRIAAGVNAALLPVKSVVNVARGVGDVVLLPIQGARARRGRSGSDAVISHAVGATTGLRRGITSLLKAVTLEAIKVGVVVTSATQTALEVVSDVVGGDTPPPSRPTVQPQSAGAGVTAAYSSVKRSMGTTANTIVTVPVREYKRTGPKGAVKAVVRGLPVAVLQPLIGTTEAVTKSLIGARNSIDKSSREDEARKYKKR